MADIVVGYDGSSQSLQAVEAAADEARWRAGQLRIIHVYEPSDPKDVDDLARVTATSMWADGVSGRDDAMLAGARLSAATKEARAQHEAQKAVDRMVRGLGDTVLGLSVTTTVIAGDKAAEAILDAAAAAQLLVVGSRGRGGVRGLLGSVSQHCVRHAPCSVLVVRDR